MLIYRNHEYNVSQRLLNEYKLFNHGDLNEGMVRVFLLNEYLRLHPEILADYDRDIPDSTYAYENMTEEEITFAIENGLVKELKVMRG